MGRWKKNETEYVVNLNHDARRGCIAIIPKPVIEMIGMPDTIMFRVKRGKITVEAGD